MKKKVMIGVLMLGVLLVTACGKNPVLSNGDEVLASIEGFDLTANEVYKELKKKYGTNIMINLVDRFIADKEIEDTKEAEKTAKDQLNSMKLQYQQMGMDFTQALLQAGFASENEYLNVLILESLRSELVNNYLSKNLTEDEINKYYNDEIFGEITVRHILIKSDAASDATDAEKATAEEEAKKKAEDLIVKLNEGADFSELAKENSDDGTASDGGLFANFNKQQVVSEFWDASYNLEDGKYTATPVKTQYGYHIILRVSAKDKPELETVKDTVTDAIVSKKLTDDENLLDKTLVDIRKDYKLDIVDSDIDRTYKSIVNGLYTN